jgi:peptide chain release factor subunit 1
VATITWETLRELAGFQARRGCAISVYVNLDPSITPTAGDAMTRVNSILSEGERSNGAIRDELSHEQRVGLKSDFERIRRYFDDDLDRDGAQGLAVFSSGLDDVWTTIGLPAPVPDKISVGRGFYVAPLVPLVGVGEGAIVAVVDRERGNIYRLHDGRLEEVVDHSEDAPRRHDQGGWSQANYQRHIDKLSAEHMKVVADEVDRLVRDGEARAVAIVGREEARPEFMDLLSQQTRAAVAGWAHAEAHATPAELLDVVAPVLAGRRAQLEEQLLARWQEESGRGGRASSGWASTLEAASDGRVEVLLYQEGADRTAWQCRECGRAAASDGACPLDGTPMEQRAEGLDIAVHRTLVHGGTAFPVRTSPELGPVEGIAALLRF